MRKMILMLCIVGISSAVHAQDAHINFGIKAGLNLSTLATNDNDLDYKMKPSFNAGILAHIHLSERIAIQPELVYSGQGANYSVAGEDGHINLSYINLPVLLQYMFGNGFRLETGPQVGLLVSANSKLNGNSTDIKDDMNSIDFSWAFGASWVHESGFGIDARYNLGITNVNEIDDPKVRNSVIEVGVFYQLKGKHE